jgi:hypothetical protein
MNEKARKKIIFAILPLAVLWAAFNIPSEKEQPATGQPTAEMATEIPDVTLIPPGAGLINVKDRASQPWGADPFRSNLYQSTADGLAPLPLEWTLKGIVYTEDNPLAFINRKSVRVGDIVNEAEVIAINKKSVILEYDGQEITLAVNKG